MAGKNLDEYVLTAIFDQFAPPIYKYAVRVCQNPLMGDHIVGDTFAELVKELFVNEASPSDLRLYLYQTACIFIGRYLHDSQRYPVQPVVITSSEPDSISLPPRDDQPTPEEALFSKLSNELTEDQRHVLSLYFQEDFNLKETATILGKSVGEIRGSLRNIRKIIEDHPELLKGSLAVLLNKKKRKRKPK